MFATVCKGGYCPPAVESATKCPAGYEDKDRGVDLTGLTDEAGCNTVKKGLAGTAKCPKGSYCPAATDTSKDIKCPAGTYNDAEEKGNIDDCKACPEGKWCKEGSAAADKPCPGGSFCATRAPWPAPCPPGTFSADGGKSLADCKACTAGKYCPEGTKTPITCPLSHTCLAGAAAPTPCASGTYNTGGGLSCGSTPAGSFSYRGQGKKASCPAGFYTGDTKNSRCSVSSRDG